MIYLYKCSEHGEFEFEHKISETLEFCPFCKEKSISTKVERLISGGGGFILKGGGWASTNYS